MQLQWFSCVICRLLIILSYWSTHSSGKDSTLGAEQLLQWTVGSVRMGYCVAAVVIWRVCCILSSFLGECFVVTLQLSVNTSAVHSCLEQHYIRADMQSCLGAFWFSILCSSLGRCHSVNGVFETASGTAVYWWMYWSAVFKKVKVHML